MESMLDGYVYLLKCGAAYKIGVSAKPRRRLKQLRTGFALSNFHHSHTQNRIVIELAMKLLFNPPIEYIKSLNAFGNTPEGGGKRLSGTTRHPARKGWAESAAKYRAETQQSDSSCCGCLIPSTLKGKVNDGRFNLSWRD